MGDSLLPRLRATRFADPLAMEAANEIERLRAEVERYKDAMEPRIRSLEAGDGGIRMDLEGGACRVMAEWLADEYKRNSGINYVECRFTSREAMPGEAFVVTVQRVKRQDSASTTAGRRARAGRAAGEDREGSAHVRRFDRHGPLPQRIAGAQARAPGAGGLMDTTYTIRTVADLFDVPRDRWDAMLLDLRAWMDFMADGADEHAKGLSAELGAKVTPMQQFHWCDDGVVGFNGGVTLHIEIEDVP